MKRILAILLVLTFVFSFVACGDNNNDNNNNNQNNTNNENNNQNNNTNNGGTNTDGVMSYAEYAAAAIDASVTIEAYVQATQSWWDNKITVYAQDEDGAYFIYEMACSEEDSAKLTPGTKIRVKGHKAEWSGEVEIVDATFEIIEGNWIAEPTDVTALLGTDELINKQNMKVSFNNLVIKSISYKNDEPGDDIYVDVTFGGNDYSFCVERYLTGPDTDVYKAFAELEAGNTVDIEGFLYWYNGVNTHITDVKLVSTEAKGADAMGYFEYDAAEVDDAVVIEAYVQATQSWWDNKITVYAQDADGAYFIYEMACAEADAAKLTPGTKIKVTGHKAEWSGEIEIVDATFEILEGTWTAEPLDVTSLLGTDELIEKQNMKVAFKGLTIKSISYKNDEPGDDIYVDVTYNEKDYSFCVERYLTGPETDVYKAFATLEAGDVVDMEGFLYWYNGVNTHITAVKAAQ